MNLAVSRSAAPNAFRFASLPSHQKLHGWAGTCGTRAADLSNDITKEQIRARALELWEQRGRPVGYDLEFWLQAERELKGEGAAEGISPNAENAKSGGGSDGRA